MRIRAAICLVLAFLALPLPWSSSHAAARGPAGGRPPLSHSAAATSRNTAAYYPLAVAAILLIAGGVRAMRRSKPRVDPELRYLVDKLDRLRALARQGRADPEDLMHLSALDSRGQWWRIDPRSGTWQRYTRGSWRPARDPTSPWRSLQLAGVFLVLAGIGTIVLLLLGLTGIVSYQ